MLVELNPIEERNLEKVFFFFIFLNPSFLPHKPIFPTFFEKRDCWGKSKDTSFGTNLSFPLNGSVVLDHLQSPESQFEVVGPLSGSKKWFRNFDDRRYNLIWFSELRPQNCGWFHLLFFLHDHFIKPKAEKYKIPFLVTKSGSNLNLIEFSDPRPRYCG